MAGITGILKKLFGSKAERDMKAIKPILEKTLAAYNRIDQLSDDALRQASQDIREKIRQRVSVPCLYHTDEELL